MLLKPEIECRGVRMKEKVYDVEEMMFPNAQYRITGTRSCELYVTEWQKEIESLFGDVAALNIHIRVNITICLYRHEGITYATTYKTCYGELTESAQKLTGTDKLLGLSHFATPFAYRPKKRFQSDNQINSLTRSPHQNHLTALAYQHIICIIYMET